MSRIGLLFIILFAICKHAYAYPDFIGYGYTSCLSCHYNGAGNGPINDYGRGVWASEIAARPPWNPNADDNALSESSGFLGKTQLPYWLRPSLKYRGLTVTKNPGSDSSSSSFYKMQTDLNLVLIFDQDQKFLFSGTLGMIENAAYAAPNVPLDKDGANHLISREHFLRGQFGENTWVYVGFMDKVFGIRHPDHTAVNRTNLGLGQNDQVHGAVVQIKADKHEFFFNPYAGNLRQDKSLQTPGASMLYEYEPMEKRRYGMSFLTQKNDAQATTILALLGKFGIGQGNSFLLEAGEKSDKPQNSKETRSAYAFGQGTIRLTRGLNFQSIGQYSKGDIDTIGAESLSWGLGLIYFPVQRFELRAQAVTGRIMDPNSFQQDTWNLQTQLHVSL